MRGLDWRVVMGTIDEDAGAWDAFPFVVEVGLNMHVGGGLVLSEIGEAMAVVVEILKEFALER